MLLGLRAENYAANVTECFDRSINLVYHEFPLLNMRYRYGNFNDNLFNSTRFIRNTSNTAFICLDTVENYH